MAVTRAGNKWKVSVGSRGNRYRRTFDTQQDADIWLAEAQLAVLKGQIPPMAEAKRDRPSRTLGELSEAVYNAVWAGTRGEVTATINSASVVRVLGADTSIDAINSSSCDKLIADLKAAGNSPATINRKIAALSKMMSFAFERGWIDRKVKLSRMREAQGRIRWMTRDEYASVLDDLHLNDPAMRDLVQILTETGLRLSEALSLKWEDINDNHVRVWCNKGDKPRSVPLSDRASSTLDAIRPGGDELGPFAHFTLHSVRHRWNAMKVRLGKEGDDEFTPHCCRHTFASWLVQSGVPIYTVRELCGHKCIEVTMRYAHLSDHSMSAAIQATFNK